ncbi:hypothetical protein [Saccharicrinis sp. FJH54]|uniref:hypothetical protein n=1 Tax=unclassified Saccharicrinis TaxID=2646859 RepID=UPI0035D41CEC
MSRKTERRFLKILISVLSIPFLFFLITEIMTPDGYVSDGVTDWGIGFISLFIILPITWLIFTLIIIIVIDKIHKDLPAEKENLT